jgi:hypothetical protein
MLLTPRNGKYTSDGLIERHKFEQQLLSTTARNRL